LKNLKSKKYQILNKSFTSKIIQELFWRIGNIPISSKWMELNCEGKKVQNEFQAQLLKNAISKLVV